MKRKPAKSFEDLIVWQKAHQWVLGVYRYSEGFPRRETYGLAAQLRDSAVSVPGNIAEGFKRRGRRDKVRFLNIAQSSLEESRYYLILGRDLEYGDTAGLSAQADEVAKLLASYMASVEEGSS